MLLPVAATLYKARGVPTKQQVCAICVDRTRGKTGRLDLGRGVTVWLCADHGSHEFRTRRSGRDFVLTLGRLWSAHGCLTKQRSRALDDHLAANRSAPAAPRRRPGSYAWPALRREAEELFRQGANPAAVISQLRRRHADDYASVPSVRTMRRWYFERRWMPPCGQHPGGGGSGGKLVPIISGPRWRTGQASPGQSAGHPQPPAPPTNPPAQPTNPPSPPADPPTRPAVASARRGRAPPERLEGRGGPAEGRLGEPDGEKRLRSLTICEAARRRVQVRVPAGRTAAHGLGGDGGPRRKRRVRVEKTTVFVVVACGAAGRPGAAGFGLRFLVEQ